MKRLQMFLDWWLGKTHWWRPRTCFSSCSVCGHVCIPFGRRTKVFYYEQTPEREKEKEELEKATGFIMNAEIYYSVCNKCDMPDAKGKRRMYIYNPGGGCIPANDTAFQFELGRAGESGAMYQKKIIIDE